MFGAVSQPISRSALDWYLNQKNRQEVGSSTKRRKLVDTDIAGRGLSTVQEDVEEVAGTDNGGSNSATEVGEDDDSSSSSSNTSNAASSELGDNTIYSLNNGHGSSDINPAARRTHQANQEEATSNELDTPSPFPEPDQHGTDNGSTTADHLAPNQRLYHRLVADQAAMESPFKRQHLEKKRNSPSMKAELDLLDLVRKHKLPLCAYESIKNWATTSAKRGHDFRSSTLRTRSVVLDDLRDQFGLKYEFQEKHVMWQPKGHLLTLYVRPT